MQGNSGEDNTLTSVVTMSASMSSFPLVPQPISLTFLAMRGPNSIKRRPEIVMLASCGQLDEAAHENEPRLAAVVTVGDITVKHRLI